MNLFEEEDYSPLPGIAIVLGIVAALLTIGTGIGWYFCSRGNL